MDPFPPVDDELVARALATIGERFSMGVIVFDGSLEILWSSPATPAVLGRTCEELLGCSALDLVHPDDLDLIVPVVTPVLEDPESMLVRPTAARTVELPVRVCTSTGEYRWAAVSGRVMDADGHIVVTVRPGDERQALDRVLNLLGHREHLDATLLALLELTCAHFDSADVVVVHDVDGRTSILGLSAGDVGRSSAGEDAREMLARLREWPSGGIEFDEERWICPVLSRNGESVLAALVMSSPRSTGPTRYDETVMERVTSLTSLAFERADDDRMLRYDASTDHLTGALNRRSFDRRLLSLALDDAFPVAVYFVDLDRFKEINDRFGHAIGDDVLIAVSNRLVGVIRSDDFVGRLGGDEFVVACPGLALDEVEATVERFRRAVEVPVHTSGRQIDIALSIGVAVASDEDGLESVVDRSDSSMYRDKHERRRRWSGVSFR